MANGNDDTGADSGLSAAAGSLESAKIRSHGLVNSPEHAMRWLERLTPGGSEFHNDPENCFYLLIRERDSRWEVIKRQQKRIRELEKILSSNDEMRHRYRGKRCWDWNEGGQIFREGQSRGGCIGCSSIDLCVPSMGTL